MQQPGTSQPSGTRVRRCGVVCGVWCGVVWCASLWVHRYGWVWRRAGRNDGSFDRRQLTLVRSADLLSSFFDSDVPAVAEWNGMERAQIETEEVPANQKRRVGHAKKKKGIRDPCCDSQMWAWPSHTHGRC